MKEEFIKQLKEFYMEAVGNPETIEDIYYKRECENGPEWVYIIFTSKSAKRFSVWGDSFQGILIDFVRFLDNMDSYPWIKIEEEK